MFTKYIRGLSLAAAFIVASASVGFAQDTASDTYVTLKSKDGALSLSGKLLEFDGENYLINTTFGDVLVNLDDVDCEGENCPDLSKYVKEFGIAGSGIIADTLLPALLNAYSAETEYGILADVTEGAKSFDFLNADNESVARILVASNTSAEGLDALAGGSADLAMTTRGPNTAESIRIRDAGFGDVTEVERQKVVALDGLVVLVSQNNAVQGLTIKQVSDIFAGKITNWSEVGGANETIKVYLQAENTDNTAYFRTAIFASDGGNFAQSATIVDDIATVVAQDPNGIGYTSYANRGSAELVSIGGTCGISTAASPFTIKSEDYPLTTRLAIYTPNTELPEVMQGLVDYIASSNAQNTVAEVGLVNQQFRVEAAGAQRARFANAILLADSTSFGNLQGMAKELRNAERLSVTFRFDGGTDALDARGLGDILRLAEYLGSEDFSNTEILLVGFTDSKGASSTNAVRSARLARSVSDQLGAVDGVQVTTMGFGEVAPLVCADVPQGATINRRVEVWMRVRG